MIRWFCALMMIAGSLAADVRVDLDRSRLHDGWRTLELRLGLDKIVPYRAFTLDAPRRLVLDFAEVDFTDVPIAQIHSGRRSSGLRAGPLRPGWSRLVVDLTAPLVIDQIGMTTVADGADVAVTLKLASPEAFAKASGAPPDPGWDVVTGFDPQVAAEIARSTDFVVVIDPGHGGIDPGAIRGGIKEADLMLVMAGELAFLLDSLPGVTAVKTRDRDTFVSLSARLTLARRVGADLFISLHADALAEDEARGATVYTLSTGGGDAASQRIVERHARGDLLAGVDLNASEDRVARALMDLARAETWPASRRFADALVDMMRRSGVRVNNRARREGQFAVLTAADFPSVLIETGFLSNPQDRAVLATAEGRARINLAIRDAVALLAR